MMEDIFKSICEKIKDSEKILKKFSTVKSDTEIFSLAYDLCINHVSQLKFKPVGKSNEKSATCRKEGNVCFEKSLFWDALNLYNKSIALAKIDSEELGFAFGNRAACLLRLQFPKEALHDVDKAISLSSSNTFKNKLISRREQCLSFLQLSPNNSSTSSFKTGETPPLGRQRSLFFDSCSNALEIACDEIFERHIIVNSDVKVGEVLIVEKPFSSVILPNYFYSHCSACFKRFLNLIPCNNCTTAMFCSKECLSSSKHTVECHYMEILTQINAERMEFLSLKILTDASKQGRELEKLYRDVLEFEVVKRETNDYKSYTSLNFLKIYELVTNSEKRTVADLFYRSVISVLLIFILEKYTTYFHHSINHKEKTKFKYFCGGFILHFLQSLPCNAHEISEYKDFNLLEIGAGAYATLSLINHSCDPNVVRYSCGNEIVLRAIKPIKKGEQLFDNYGYHYATHDFEERQRALMKQYYFKCKCEACLNNWPTYHFLPAESVKEIQPIDMSLYKDLTEKFEKDMEKVLNGDYSQTLIERNYFYLEFLDKFVQRPWMNYNKCQELIKHCLNFYSNYFKENKIQ